MAAGEYVRMELVNAADEKAFGCTRKEMLGQPMEILLPGRMRDIHQQHHAGYFVRPQNRRIGIGLDLTACRKDGFEFPLEVNLSGSETTDGMRAFALMSDIKERKKTEERLRRSEERFRRMADNSPVLIWMSGTDKLCIWFNKPWLDFVGRPMEKEVNNGWTENVHPDDLRDCIPGTCDALQLCPSLPPDSLTS